MRSLRIREGARKGRLVLGEAGRLIRNAPAATLELGLVLAILPALLKAFLLVRANGLLLDIWAGWVESLLGAAAPTDSLMVLLSMTLQQTGINNLWSSLLDLLKSLILSPLLLSSLALLYNGYVKLGERAALEAASTAGRNVKGLIFVALACMLAEWIVQMVPSLASGILSLLAEMLSWIPVLGTVSAVLAIVLSILVSLLTDFAVIVIFCYVWICAACEGVPGFGALVRSWQLTRNALHETISALLMLTLLRWLSIAVLGLLWVFAARPLGIPLTALIYAAYAVSACFTVYLGATTSALYQRRPTHYGPRPGQFQQNGPNIQNMKRANID